MIVLKQHAYNLYSELSHRSGRAHRDESGTEAVEWIAIGASLFMLAAVLSVVMDLNGAQLGRSLTGQVENVVGMWGNNRGVTAVNRTLGDADTGSIGTDSIGTDSIGTDSIVTVASAEESAALSGSGGRSALNTSASFSDSATSDSMTSSTTGSTAATQSRDSEAGVDSSGKGNLIIDGSQQRQGSGLSGNVEETEVAQSNIGPVREMWNQIKAHVRPISDAVNRTFSSMFRDE